MFAALGGRPAASAARTCATASVAPARPRTAARMPRGCRPRPRTRRVRGPDRGIARARPGGRRAAAAAPCSAPAARNRARASARDRSPAARPRAKRAPRRPPPRLAAGDDRAACEHDAASARISGPTSQASAARSDSSAASNVRRGDLVATDVGQDRRPLGRRRLLGQRPAQADDRRSRRASPSGAGRRRPQRPHAILVAGRGRQQQVRRDSLCARALRLERRRGRGVQRLALAGSEVLVQGRPHDRVHEPQPLAAIEDVGTDELIGRGPRGRVGQARDAARRLRAGCRLRARRSPARGRRRAAVSVARRCSTNRLTAAGPTDCTSSAARSEGTIPAASSARSSSRRYRGLPPVAA